MALRSCLAGLCILAFSNLFGIDSLMHQQQKGIPHIKNYLPAEYQAHAQNWCIKQAPNGIMYFANNMGVLQYDGSLWQTLTLPGQRRTVNISIDRHGKIYAVSTDDFGHFIPDHKGKLIYKSLFSEIKAVHTDVGWMIESWPTENGTFFLSDKYLFLQKQNGEFQTWKANKNIFIKSFYINGKLYVLQNGVGLQTMENDSLQLLPGTEALADEVSLTLLNDNKDGLIIGSESGRFYSLKNDQLRLLFQLPQQYMLNTSFQSGVILNDSTLALAAKQGIIVVNKTGELIQTLDKTTGLPGNLVNSIFLDNEGAMWAALDNGISQIDISSPYSFYGSVSGINETTLKVIEHHGTMYCATTGGLYYLVRSSGKNNFIKIPNLNVEVWDLFSDGKKFLAATTEGLFEIKNNKATPLEVYTRNAFSICRSKVNPGIFFIGGSFGLIVLEYTADGNWKNTGYIQLSNSAATFFWLHEEADGKLWASAYNSGIYSLTFNKKCKEQPDCLLQPTIRDYGLDDGLEKDRENQMFTVNNRTIFTSGSKMLSFDGAQDRFIPTIPLQNNLLDTTSLILSLEELKNNALVLCTASPEKCFLGLPDENNEYIWNNDYFFRLNDNPIYDILSENGLIWMSGLKGVALYKLPLTGNKEVKYNTLIRQVSVNNDSVLFYGEMENYSPPILNYGINKLRFKFAASSFSDNETTVFSYFMEGLDDDWSDWTSETIKDYTHLTEGDYTFQLKAKDVHGNIGSPASFKLTILPPWYRTIPAYLLYGVLCTAMLLGIIKLRSRHLENDKRKLEEMIRQRTIELERKNEQLKEVDQMKSRFFANVSHEFRTPLTLIMGPLEQLIKDDRWSISDHQKWQVMAKNTKRLHQLINQLLDLSKLESGKLTLQLKKGDVLQYIRAIAAGFSSMEEGKKIQYIQKIPYDPCEVYFDHDKINKILTNLLSNAFKFTGSYGKVIIEAWISSSSKNDAQKICMHQPDQEGWLHLTVQDTGIGIKKHHLPLLFNRFYQADDSDTKETEGSGIGLALVRELVDLYHGKVDVTSEENLGTIFNVILPVGRNHFSDKHIIEDVHLPDEYLPQEIESSTAEHQKTEDHISGLPLLLLIEDNTDLRNYIKECLGDKYNYGEASNGGEGYKIARKCMPDLIITDLMMPGMGGSAFCQKLKSDELLGHIPVIMLTAKSAPGEKVDGLRIGADDYITKPFHVEELKARVKNLIDQRNMLRDRYKKEIHVLPGNVTVNSMDEQFLKKALEVVEKNMSDPDFGIDHLLEALNTSRTHLHRKLKAITGQSASEFIRTIRLKRAAQLLEKDSNVVSQIGYETGFNDHSYFTKCFKKYFNISPSEYAAMHHKNTQIKTRMDLNPTVEKRH